MLSRPFPRPVFPIFSPGAGARGPRKPGARGQRGWAGAEAAGCAPPPPAALLGGAGGAEGSRSSASAQGAQGLQGREAGSGRSRAPRPTARPAAPPHSLMRRARAAAPTPRPAGRSGVGFAPPPGRGRAPWLRAPERLAGAVQPPADRCRHGGCVGPACAAEERRRRAPPPPRLVRSGGGRGPGAAGRVGAAGAALKGRGRSLSGPGGSPWLRVCAVRAAPRALAGAGLGLCGPAAETGWPHARCPRELPHAVPRPSQRARARGWVCAVVWVMQAAGCLCSCPHLLPPFSLLV